MRGQSHLASDLTFTPKISKWFTFFNTFIFIMNLCDRTQSLCLWNCATAKLKYCSHITDRNLLWISPLYHPYHLGDWIYPSKLKHLNFLLQRITLASLKDKIPWTIIYPGNKFFFYILLNFHCSSTFVQCDTLALQTKDALPFFHKW